MSNIVTSESRLNNSRLLDQANASDESILNTLASDDSPLREADLWAEFALVRAALLHLPADNRLMLQGVVIEGRKPAVVAAELGRAGTAGSALLLRSKAMLRRGLLVELLSRAGDEHAANATLLPSRVHAAPTDHDPGDRGIAHILQCETCRASWATFAVIGSGLGVLLLLVIGQNVLQPAAAAAVVADPLLGTGTGRGSASGREDSAQTASAVDASGGMSKVRAAIVRAAPRRVARLVALAAAGVVLVVGGATTTVGIVSAADSPATGSSTESVVSSTDAPAAEFTIVVTYVGEVAQVAVELDIAGSGTWAIQTASIILLGGAYISQSPDGWECAPDAGGGDCSVAGIEPTGGTFVIAWTDEGAAAGAFRIVIESRTSDGRTLTSSGSGTLSRPPSV